MFKAIKITKIILGLLLVLSLPSCFQGKLDPLDTSLGLERTEYKNALVRNKIKEKETAKNKLSTKGNSIPKMSKLIVPAPPPVIGGQKIISFSVTDAVPLKDVLMELGRVTDIDIDIDPEISGRVNINAKNKPLKEIIDRIATQGKLRYSYKNGVIYFKSDKPYMKNYFVDYLTGGSLWDDVESNITSILNLSVQSSGADNFESGIDSGSSSSGLFSNKSAGIITINANHNQHKKIADYLSDVELSASAQVLIEAKLVEVFLDEEHKTGINWSSSGDTPFSLNGGFDSSAPLAITSSRFLGINTLTSSISFLEKFGTTRTLSSPRIHAINNQKATLNFSNKLVYFTIEQEQSNASDGATTSTVTSTITSTKQEEDIGVSIEITPSINVNTNEVTMNVVPTITVSNTTVTDPASPQDSTGAVIEELRNNIPVVQSRTLSTIAKVKSGNIIIIGGLMEENATNIDRGVPFLSKIPILGRFFKEITRTSEVKETVIFIKPTILDSKTRLKKYDHNLLDKFNGSAKPFL